MATKKTATKTRSTRKAPAKKAASKKAAPKRSYPCPDCPIGKRTGKPSGLKDPFTLCPTCEGSGTVKK